MIVYFKIYIDSVSFIDYSCGRELIYKILNEKELLGEEKYKKIISYLKSNDIKNDLNLIMDTIVDEDTIDLLRVSQLNEFSYKKNKYTFIVGDTVSIIPTYDGDQCTMSITPTLPSGLLFNVLTGEIKGSCEEILENTKYEVTCHNVTNTIKYEIELQIMKDAKFISEFKNENLVLSNDCKTVTHINDTGYYHCYLNLVFDKGIHHIKYRIEGNDGDCFCIFGATTNNKYEGKSLDSNKNTCNFGIGKKAISISGENGEIVQKPNRIFKENEIFECIFNIEKKTFSLKYEDNEEIVLFKNFTIPLYPFVITRDKNSIHLVKYWNEY